MSPENRSPKRRIIFSSVAARQFREITGGGEPPGEVDPSLDSRVPPITSQYTEWERAKFASMIGKVPTRFDVLQTSTPYSTHLLGIAIGGYDIWVVMGRVEGLELPEGKVDTHEYVPIDVTGCALTWVEDTGNGINMMFGEGEAQFTVNARMWAAAEHKPDLSRN